MRTDIKTLYKSENQRHVRWCYMSVAIAVIALFIIICVLVVAYVCMCLMTSSKDADEVERRLFNEKFNRDKGDKE